METSVPRDKPLMDPGPPDGKSVKYPVYMTIEEAENYEKWETSPYTHNKVYTE